MSPGPSSNGIALILSNISLLAGPSTSTVPTSLVISGPLSLFSSLCEKGKMVGFITSKLDFIHKRKIKESKESVKGWLHKRKNLGEEKSSVMTARVKISHLVASLPTSCVRTACPKLSTSLEQAVNIL
jgi:hypothetical protein